jgi:hypothetical protein
MSKNNQFGLNPINLDAIIPDFEKSLNDVNTYSHHLINYSFLTNWQKTVRKIACKISGHTMIRPIYNNPYCSNCMAIMKDKGNV